MIIPQGEYIITPDATEEQVVETKGKYLKEDIIVQEIPYSEEPNSAGGLTITIG